MVPSLPLAPNLTLLDVEDYEEVRLLPNGPATDTEIWHEKVANPNPNPNDDHDSNPNLDPIPN